MKIISSFKDFYDSAQAFGHDDKLTFVRHTRVLNNKDNDHKEWVLKGLGRRQAPISPNFNEGTYRRYLKRYVYSSGPQYAIAFCGKLYIIYSIDGKFYKSVPEFFDAVERGTSVDNYNPWPVRNNDSKEERLKKHRAYVTYQRKRDEKWKGRSRFDRLFESRNNFDFSEAGWERWKEDSKGKMIIPTETHRHWGTPIIAWVDKNYVINPCLKELGFQKHVDPYTAFQEIDMYLGNNMADQFDPTIGRTDNEIRDSKGFDTWSFKTSSPGRKRRKQKKK